MLELGISISSNKISNTGVTSVNGKTGAVTGLVTSVIPDYTAPVIASAKTFTAPADGVVMIRGELANWTTYTITINNTSHTIIEEEDGYAHFPYIVKKNDTIQWAFKNNENYIFWPFA